MFAECGEVGHVATIGFDALGNQDLGYCITRSTEGKGYKGKHKGVRMRIANPRHPSQRLPEGHFRVEGQGNAVSVC
jgi:hypothetical protein